MRKAFKVAGKILAVPLLFIIFGIMLLVDSLSDSESHNLYYNK